MAHRLIWSAMSIRDVDEIATFIARTSPRYARIVVAKLFEAANELASGIVPETDRPDVRQRRVYQYRLIVRVAPATVEIIAVLHGPRDVAVILETRE